MFDQSYSRALRIAASPSLLALSGLFSKYSILDASCPVFPASKSNPFTPSSTMLGMSPTRDATTGRPALMASRMLRGVLIKENIDLEGSTTTSESWYTASISFLRPRNMRLPETQALREVLQSSEPNLLIFIGTLREEEKPSFPRLPEHRACGH